LIRPASSEKAYTAVRSAYCKAWRTTASATVTAASQSNTQSFQEKTMAKGQLRGNKEAKKPKKEKAPAAPAGSFIPPKANPAGNGK
jgi:hypothetical protein